MPALPLCQKHSIASCFERVLDGSCFSCFQRAFMTLFESEPEEQKPECGGSLFEGPSARFQAKDEALSPPCATSPTALVAFENLMPSDLLTFNSWLTCRCLSKTHSLIRPSEMFQVKLNMKAHHRLSCRYARELLVDGEWSERDAKCCLRSCRKPTGLWLPLVQQKCLGKFPMSSPQTRVARYIGNCARFQKHWTVVCSEECYGDAQSISQILSAQSNQSPYGVILGVDRV